MAENGASSSNRSSEQADLSVDEIIRSIKLSNSQTSDARLKFLLEKLIDQFRSYARETRLTNEEWLQTLQFITACGQNSTDVRQELFLLSDILGFSTLMDVLNHPKPPNGTPSTVLGPFHTDDALDIPNGDSIASPGKGETCLVLATVKDTAGRPIEGAKVDVWETDGHGRYDNQYENRDRPDMRARLTSNADGEFYFKCVKPVSYSVPRDGPVGILLGKLERHAYRPAHIHFYISVPGNIYDDLVTALYIRGDPYESSDAVFGVKQSLIVDIVKLNDATVAKKYDVDEQDWLIKYDFVLTTRTETEALLSMSTDH